ncbi:MAG: DNA repair protein RecN [Bacteroidales bacterium]|nr:DNA repair protein RecN [Bacteroidales bacterium]
MLVALHIRHYVLIDSLDIAFPEGLLIITGQTGAGKSILLGALSLAMGAKADPSAISPGADSCVVEAEFEAPLSLKPLFDENDLEWDAGHLIIRRVVHQSRSRSFVNDMPVTAAFLAELSRGLLDIHSQHQSLLLKDKSWQLSLLDHYAGNAGLLKECSDCWRELQQTRARLSECVSKLDRLNADSQYNTARYQKLLAAALHPGELEELETEHRALAHAEEIKCALEAARQACNPAEGPGVTGALAQARRMLEKVQKFVPGLDELCGRIESARIELDDILSSLDSADENLNLNEGRLHLVEDRLSLLYDLMGKYSCASLDDLIACRDSLGQSVNSTADLEELAGQLRQTVHTLEARHNGICDKLAASRLACSIGFADEVTASLHFLELEGARFQVQLCDCDPGERGRQTVNFLFCGEGQRIEEVSKCASGGEISRIMLCLKALMARFTAMPTMIFDEIDSGVSGSVADKMGSMICRMGESMQVLAITHLPQVAAKGNAHYLVSKQTVGDRSVSTIDVLEGEERVKEIARLLSGATISEEALANARVLLG